SERGERRGAQPPPQTSERSVEVEGSPGVSGGASPLIKKWRPWLRAFHRDVGYVAVGLTLVCAGAGLAVNHIAPWDPNFHTFETTIELGTIPTDTAHATETVLTRLAVKERPRDVYRASDERLDIVLDHRTLHVNPKTGRVIDEGQKPRVLLRIANW